MSCYCSNLICYDVDSGKRFPLKCRSYTCSEHGKYNRGRLRNALEKYLKSWSQIRFWTFTLSSATYSDPHEHVRDLQKVWRYFTTELRRNRICTKSEKNTQYIKFCEPHKSGYFHFHAVFDRYVPWSKIYSLWQAAVSNVTGLDGDRGGCHVKGINNAKNTSYYIVKYVTKSAGLMPKGGRIWSKSSRIALFPKKKTNRTFVIYNTATDEWIGATNPPPSLLEVYITQVHNEIHQFELFPPP